MNEFVIHHRRLIRVMSDGVESAIQKVKDGEGEVTWEAFTAPMPSRPPVEPIPRDQWPMWTKALAQFATENDKGIGDVAARMIGTENSAKFKAWHLATFGRPCGCNGRQNLWNQKYPLNLKAT